MSYEDKKAQAKLRDADLEQRYREGQIDIGDLEFSEYKRGTNSRRWLAGIALAIILLYGAAWAVHLYFGGRA